MSQFSDFVWCSDLFNSLADGGMWGVPRSGLIFKKTGGMFVLTEVMPHAAEMPMSEEELLAYQHEDYLQIKMNFEEAGISVGTSIAIKSKVNW